VRVPEENKADTEVRSRKKGKVREAGWGVLMTQSTLAWRTPVGALRVFEVEEEGVTLAKEERNKEDEEKAKGETP